MKHIFLNLKRFDVPTRLAGVNSLADVSVWGKYIVETTQEELGRYDPCEVEFVQFFPEAHLIGARCAMRAGGNLKLGCQGVFRHDTAAGGNFGSFTTNLPASAARAMGCSYALIGHCEERADKLEILSGGGAGCPESVDALLNQEVLCAQGRGLSVLFCVGEREEEQENWQEVLGRQLEKGLKGADLSKVVIGYEPVWSIGPGKTPADKSYITMAARFIKQSLGEVDIVYGGGLTSANAGMLAEIPEVSGGLIALTRFKGEIGFYPDEYLDIVRTYLDAAERSKA